jgi:hypothetical protein
VKGDLERLIAAVEAGALCQGDVLSLEDGAMIDGALARAGADQALWEEVTMAMNGSLDAALRLHEALLPGWGWAVDWRDDGFVMAWLSPNLNRMSEAERATAPLVDERNYSGKPARAWLLAILRALAKREEG